MSFFDRFATAPISWGICEVPGWGHQLSVERVLAEMAGLGFSHTELGSLGWLPSTAEELRSVLKGNSLALLAGFVPVVLHDETQVDVSERAAIEAADLLAAAGAKYFNTAPVMSWDWQPRRELTVTEWSRLIAGLAMVEEVCAERGLTQVVHEHWGTAIETVDDVNHLLEASPVLFVLDTAHMSLGGCDPLEFASRNSDRVGLVHLKDMRLRMADAFKKSQLGDTPLSLMGAVQDGIWPAIGQGDLPIAQIIETLEANGYDGWYVVEQDCAITGAKPAPGDGPVKDVQQSIEFLAGLPGLAF
ncbi:MAG: TIM barrel protein [Acidimicrobiales bacterium]|nr:TIM barrel protein [Acidimicrobiales bacterium]